MPLSPVHNVHISQLILYARTCFAFEDFSKRGNTELDYRYLNYGTHGGCGRSHGGCGRSHGGCGRTHGGCGRSARDIHSSAATDPTCAIVRGSCCHTLHFVIAIWIMITFHTSLTSLFCIATNMVRISLRFTVYLITYLNGKRV
jgi:hypothetical protein